MIIMHTSIWRSHTYTHHNESYTVHRLLYQLSTTTTPPPYQEGMLSEEMGDPQLVVLLKATARPHIHRDVGQGGVVLQGCYSHSIAQLGDL